MIKDWFKTLFRIVRNYDKNNAIVNTQLYSTARQIDAVEQIMRDRTEIHTDLAYRNRQSHTIIVCGQYKNNDFIEIFNLREADFGAVVDQLQEMNKYARIKTVDAPIQLKAYINRTMKS